MCSMKLSRIILNNVFLKTNHSELVSMELINNIEKYILNVFERRKKNKKTCHELM